MKAAFPRFITRALSALALCVICLAWARPAHAYAWMIHRGFSGCATCHADPSGGGLLNAYGRAQGEQLLRTHYTSSEDASSGSVGDFLFGAIELPDDVLLGGDYRGAYFSSELAGAPHVPARYLQMQADLTGQVAFGRLRINGSIGYDHLGAEAADLTLRAQDNLISRVHWLGLDIGANNEVLLRAGRMNLPYGLRSIEHTLFIHSPPGIPGSGVRNDLSQGQQHGVAVAFTSGAFRGEVMAILGNYQLSPDEFRERGYSAYLEWAESADVAVGASSLVTHSHRDVFYAAPLYRHAHGLFGRFVPWKPLTLLAEADFLFNSQDPKQTLAGRAVNQGGYASLLQADLEVIQGLHLIATGESTLPAVHNAYSSYSAWGSLAWFFAPHADVRFDAIEQSLGVSSTPITVTTLLGQLHVYL